MSIVSLPYSNASIEQAVNHLEIGYVIGFGTETVYGLGGDATNPDAIAAIYRLKNRPTINPLIVHFAAIADIENYTSLPKAARSLGEVFWPGPLTLVLPYRPRNTSGNQRQIPEAARAGLPSLAVRIPAHQGARDLIAKLGRPIAAPSANRSGHLSPTTAQHVASEFNQPDDGKLLKMILDGGPTQAGVESSVVSLLDPENPLLLRWGAIREEDIREALKGKLERHPLLLPHQASEGDKTRLTELPPSPGLLLRHYAPQLPLSINQAEPPLSQDIAWVGFGDSTWGERGYDENLSPKADLAEAAHNLFAILRKIDQSGRFRGIAVAPIPDMGLGCAINDRLRRAARP